MLVSRVRVPKQVAVVFIYLLDLGIVILGVSLGGVLIHLRILKFVEVLARAIVEEDLGLFAGVAIFCHWRLEELVLG